jgi:hypothetical protein
MARCGSFRQRREVKNAGLGQERTDPWEIVNQSDILAGLPGCGFPARPCEVGPCALRGPNVGDAQPNGLSAS